MQGERPPGGWVRRTHISNVLVATSEFANWALSISPCSVPLKSPRVRSRNSM
jgi:hypothetical protein